MTFVHNPFALEPVRENILQIPQLHKEIHSLETHIKEIESKITREKQAQDEIKSHQTKKNPEYQEPTLPMRFQNPESWNYPINKQNPLYTTTTNDYGSHKPSFHDMPAAFRGQSSKFSEHLNLAGPYRNYSLNI